MEQSKDIVIVTQARFGSTRLPGKIMMKINEEELLKIHLKRLSQSQKADKIIVATTIEIIDNPVASAVTSWGYEIFRGSENDVLDRFYQATKDYHPKWVVRLTSDCPLLDPALIDGVIEMAIANDLDYCANILVENFPDGQDVEVMKFEALEYAWINAKLNSEREHVTPYIRNNTDFKGGTIFKAMNYSCENNFNAIRMTVDEEQDFTLISNLINHLGTDLTWREYTDYILKNDLSAINKNIVRNEGYIKSINND